VLDLAVIYTRSSLLGPPLCRELVELIAHVFTEEAKTIDRYLSSASKAVEALPSVDGAKDVGKKLIGKVAP
jgi:hypothetical protein